MQMRGMQPGQPEPDVHASAPKSLRDCDHPADEPNDVGELLCGRGEATWPGSTEGAESGCRPGVAAPENLVFTIPGAPFGKERARAARRGKYTVMFTPQKTVSYAGLVAYTARQAMNGAALMDGAVFVQLDIRCPIPASWSKKKKAAALNWEIFPTVKPDTDNIIKAIYDGLNGVVWRDDVQAVDGAQQKRYSSMPGVIVKIHRIGPGA
jgi:Holliday junction resolvase RusA-like endonuclease